MSWITNITALLFGADPSKRLDAINTRLDNLTDRMAQAEFALNLSEEQDIHMTAAMERIRQEVSENRDAIAATKVLIGNLAQQIRDNAANETALRELADSLDAQTNELSQAVAENTPAFTPSGN